MSKGTKQSSHAAGNVVPMVGWTQSASWRQSRRCEKDPLSPNRGLIQWGWKEGMSVCQWGQAQQQQHQRRKRERCAVLWRKGPASERGKEGGGCQGGVCSHFSLMEFEAGPAGHKGEGKWKGSGTTFVDSLCLSSRLVTRREGLMISLQLPLSRRRRIRSRRSGRGTGISQ